MPFEGGDSAGEAIHFFAIGQPLDSGTRGVDTLLAGSDYRLGVRGGLVGSDLQLAGGVEIVCGGVAFGLHPLDRREPLVDVTTCTTPLGERGL